MTDVLRTSFFILVISSLTQGYQDKIPEGFALSVYHDCGPSVAYNQPIISIMTDLNGAGAVAHCRNGDFDFLTEDGIFLDLFPSLMDSQFYCVFDRLNNTNTYVLKATMFWGDMAGSIDTHNREYLITCNFDEKGSPKTEETVIGDRILAPKEISHNMGEPTTSDLSLDLVNVRHEVIADSIQLDRYVRLIASTDGSSGEVGIKPVSCDAVGIPSGARHAIFRAGCGDGSVFGREEAFITKGLKAYSPYFGAFKVDGDDSVDFECNLTLCFQNCDGSSCENERRKRSELIHDFPNRRGGVYFIKTKPFRCENVTDKEFGTINDNKENDLPNLLRLKTVTFDLSIEEDFVSSRQMWILVSVLGFLVFVALFVSLYNCVNDIKPKDSGKLDIGRVETTGTSKTMDPVDKPCSDTTEPLPDINIITASYCPLPVNKV
ncbi:hypothetical protein LOTGIDRAFT_228754 [Lottia gigantea]|uniref:Vitelline envelope sperm lysin receptor C-terminal domain-containing protein n=1 Tax=Lottia gigantea TaxID=225164 RepID=V3ZIY8_LOTGI|nr:hypothetical protein LOTGIDRAFT_228754 [Lottia gigantea]ESO91268.1 hypothetical protein LOTGIDRAFT_228754 [Lottia gigantea]